VIRTLVALDGGLARGALAFVLSRDDDIEVVGEVADAANVRSVVGATRPNVMIVDLELIGTGGLPSVCAVRKDVPGCVVLILAKTHRSPSSSP
jgi:two-component system, NarL family, response regulator DesR